MGYGSQGDAKYTANHLAKAASLCSCVFDLDWRDNLYQMVIHELAHVLGLRYEFAMKPGRFEPKAFQIGEMNPLSVMKIWS